MDSLSALRSRSETSVHRFSAVSSCWRSTRTELAPLAADGKEGEHSSVQKRSQCLFTTSPEHEKQGHFQGFLVNPQTPPHLWRSSGQKVYSLGKTGRAQEISRRHEADGRCGKACDRVALYTGAGPSFEGFDLSFISS